jgi:hypothetical protein
MVELNSQVADGMELLGLFHHADLAAWLTYQDA